MTTTGFGKRQWVELFEQIGLDESTMHQWHAAFERQWPEDHGRFLEWLGVGKDDTARIREASRTAWAGR